MILGRLNHVGVATPSIGASVAFYRDVMGATTIHAPFDLPAQGVRVCFVDTPNTQIELIEPLGDDSPIAAFLAKNPAGGQHHLCYEVPDIGEALAWFRSSPLRSGNLGGGVRRLRLGRVGGEVRRRCRRRDAPRRCHRPKRQPQPRQGRRRS